MNVQLYSFPTPASSYADVRKKYDELKVKSRFDSITQEEQDWMDWAETYLDEEGW